MKSEFVDFPSLVAVCEDEFISKVRALLKLIMTFSSKIQLLDMAVVFYSQESILCK